LKIRGLRTESCPGIGELIIGRIDRGNHVRGTPRNKLLRKSAVAAADVKPSKIVWNVEPIQEYFADKPAPAAHQPLICFSVGEKLVSLAHVDFVSHRDVGASYARISCVKDVRFGSKADMCSANSHVRFSPNSNRESGLPAKGMSALLLKADMCGALAHVCYGPKADMGTATSVQAVKQPHAAG